MSGTTWQVFKIAFTITLVAFAGYELPTLLKKAWSIKLIVLLAICYPLGKAIEFWQIGPEFLRWHLSDFGFVPCVAWFLVQEWPLKRLEAWRRWVLAASIGLAIAVGVETIELVFQRLEVTKHAATRGDWGDMASYFLSFVILLPIARIQVLGLRAARAKTAQQKADREEAARAASRAARRNRPRRPPRSGGSHHSNPRRR